MPLHESIGKELTEGAVIPEQVALLFGHVALNLREHAKSVAPDSPEQNALLSVADGYEAISAEAQRVRNYMRTLESLPITPHEGPARDRRALGAWLQEKAVILRGFARLLNERADQAERALRELAQ